MILILGDILINHFTPLVSYLFLFNLQHSALLKILIVGLTIDLFLTNSFPFHALFLLIFWFIKRYLWPKQKTLGNFLSFYFSAILSYYLLTHILFNYFNLSSFLITLGFNLIVTGLSYKKMNARINFIG